MEATPTAIIFVLCMALNKCSMGCVYGVPLLILALIGKSVLRVGLLTLQVLTTLSGHWRYLGGLMWVQETDSRNLQVTHKCINACIAKDNCLPASL